MIWTMRNGTTNFEIKLTIKRSKEQQQKKESHCICGYKSCQIQDDGWILWKEQQLLFFCGASGSEKLFGVRTFSVDKSVSERAEILQDRPLLAKLSQGDMHALDAQYHASCMLSLHNKCRLKNTNSNLTDDSLESIVLCELVFYI